VGSGQSYIFCGHVQVTQLKASEQMHAVASEQQQKEANIKEALEEQLAQVSYSPAVVPWAEFFFPTFTYWIVFLDIYS
jgi:hypothetical protein